MKTIHPFILGSGRTGQVIARSLDILNQLHTDQFQIRIPVFIPRGKSFGDMAKGLENSALFIANPPGLHEQAIVQAEKAGFSAVFCEKPVCTDIEQIASLKKVKKNVPVFHVYRQQWGPQTIKEMILAGELGEIISIEGKIWQPSMAHRALEPSARPQDWKTDPKLNGNFGVILDLGVHWADLVSFLVGQTPTRAKGWHSKINNEPPYHDTHLHLDLEFPSSIKTFASISKVVHGATNDLEVSILGSKKAATWKFLNPDEIIVGKGRDRNIMVRKENRWGSRQPPFHGLGWIEGYIEIIRQGLFELVGLPITSYPNLKESLLITEKLLSSQITE